MSNDLPAEAARDLDRWLGHPDWVSERIAGDASARAYYRIRLPDSTTRILAWYPEQIRGDVPRFLRAWHAIAGAMPVPRVIASSDCAVLQHDAGDVTLSALLASSRETALPFYESAAELLDALQAARPEAESINPAFDEAKFGDELEMTLEFYVRRLAGVEDEAALGALRESFAALARRLVAHPYVLCHRDYHGQNIHILNGSIYVIDYQDMRLGPDTYDLASLLRDRGAWMMLGADAEERAIARRADALGQNLEVVRRRYLEALLQRSIKAIGTFARMSVVYGRSHYVEHIGPTLESVSLCARELGEWPRILKYFPFGNSIA